jgi:hypothetical protein
MKRREFIALFGGIATACSMLAPLTVHALVSRTYRIGFLGPALTSSPPIGYCRSFLAELREFGFVEGTNLAVEYRPQDDPGRIFAAEAELMCSRPELIVAAGSEDALQALGRQC